MIDNREKEGEKEFYKKFEKLVGKIFEIKTKTRTYNGIKLISIDRPGSPVRFFNFENKEGFTPKILAFAPEEIKNYGVEE